MKNLYYLLLLLFIAPQANGQSIYNMLPVCDKEQKLKDALSTSTDSIVYIMHFRPNSCPRCEGVALTLLKNLNSNSIIVFDNPNKKASTQYVSENFKDVNYPIIYDTTGVFREFIDYNLNKLIIPYIYKINVSTGRFYDILPTLGTTVNSDLIAKLKTVNMPMKCISGTQNNGNIKSINNKLWSSIINIDNNIPTPFSDPVNAVIDTELYFIDYSNDNAYIYDTNGHFLYNLPPNDAEYYYFNSSPLEKELITDLKKQLIVRAIYLSIFPKPNTNTVEIVASLPKVDVQISGIDTNVSYYNMPVVITKNRNNEDLRIDTINTFSKWASYSHQLYKPMLGNRYYSLTAKKGFPAIGTEFNAADSVNNPFSKKFYDFTPRIKIVERHTNKAIGEFGDLPQVYKDKKVGYYYFDTKCEANKKYLYLYSQFSGEIQIFKMNDILKNQNKFYRLQIFQDKISTLPTVDPRKYADKLKYIIQYKEALTSSSIEDIKSFKDDIYVVIKENKKSALIVKKYNQGMTKLLTEKIIHLENPSLIKHLSLEERNNTIALLGIEESGNLFKRCWYNISF